MARIALYFKVEAHVDSPDESNRLAAEICKAVGKIYGVRRAELTNAVSEKDEY